MGEKDKRIKELELELLMSSQKLAAGASNHAHQMQDQAEQLDRCKVRSDCGVWGYVCVGGGGVCVWVGCVEAWVCVDVEGVRVREMHLVMV